MKPTFVTFLMVLSISALHGQIFRSSSGASHLYQIDTTYQRWEIKTSQSQPTIGWQVELEKQGFGRMAVANSTIGLASVQARYENGTQTGSDLCLDIFSMEGATQATFRISHSPGISLVDATADAQHYYIAFNKAISSSDRDLFVVKIDEQGNAIWETKLGKKFGTDGTGLLQVDKLGRILLFAKHYKKVAFSVIDPTGKLIAEHPLPFLHEVSPAGFCFNPDGSITGIGSQRKYQGRETISSLVIFTLDKDFKPLNYNELRSPLVDVALDIIYHQDHYFLLANAESFSGPYDQRPNISLIAKLDNDLQVEKITTLENKDSGLLLRLAWQEGSGPIFVQRGGERGWAFHLHQMDPNLNLTQTTGVQGRLRGVNSLVPTETGLLVGGGSLSSWILHLNSR